MYIIRVRTEEGVKTFPFVQPIIPGTTEEDARKAEFEAVNKAAKYFMKTTCDGFIAKVKNENDMKGKIIRKWESNEFHSCLAYHIKGGRYSDTVWGVLGTEEECRRKAEETNAKHMCWADIHCHLEHIVGVLWTCVYTDPYKD